MSQFGFENLEVYKKAVGFVKEVYSLTKSWPKEERFSLTDQFRRASTSIALNLAEGTSGSKKEFKVYINRARGSCFECAAILDVALSLDLITEKTRKIFYDKITELSKMLSGLKSSLSTE